MLMYMFDVRQMFLKGYDKARGKHGHPIFHAFAIPHDDLMLGEIDVFHM